LKVLLQPGLRPFLEPDEIAALIKAAPSPANTIIRVLGFTGLRPCELLVLTWGDVEWGHGLHGGRVHVRRRIYKGAVDTTKTEAGTRSIDVPQQLLDILTAYRASMAPREPTGSDPVFEGRAPGRPISYSAWNETIKAIAKKAGLPKVRSYALRHGYASMLIAQGEDVRLVADQMGHRDPGLTLRVYAHALKKNRTDAMSRLGQRMVVPPSTPI
jgi:integrase